MELVHSCRHRWVSSILFHHFLLSLLIFDRCYFSSNAISPEELQRALVNGNMTRSFLISSVSQILSSFLILDINRRVRYRHLQNAHEYLRAYLTLLRFSLLLSLHRFPCIKDTDRSGTIGFNEFAGLWQYIQDWQKCVLSLSTSHCDSYSFIGQRLPTL